MLMSQDYFKSFVRHYIYAQHLAAPDDSLPTERRYVLSLLKTGLIHVRVRHRIADVLVESDWRDCRIGWANTRAGVLGRDEQADIVQCSQKVCESDNAGDE